VIGVRRVVSGPAKNRYTLTIFLDWASGHDLVVSASETVLTYHTYRTILYVHNWGSGMTSSDNIATHHWIVLHPYISASASDYED
jgi:hypothetical protein